VGAATKIRVAAATYYCQPRDSSPREHAQTRLQPTDASSVQKIPFAKSLTFENIQFPRGFNFDPTATWLYALNQKGDTIVQLAIDQSSGELSPTGLITEAPVPVSIVFTQ